MPDAYVGQVQMDVQSGVVDDTKPWMDVVEDNDRDYVLHCLRYEKYRNMPQRIVRLVTYVVPPL